MKFPSFRRTRLTPLLAAAGLTTALLGAGCGRPVRSDPKPAPLAEATGAPIGDANEGDADAKALVEFGSADAIPKTLEEKKRYKAATEVSDNLPNSEMSRDEFMKLIDDTESRIPDEAVKTEPKVVPPVEEKKTTGLMTENSPTAVKTPIPTVSAVPVVKTEEKKPVVTAPETKKPEVKKPEEKKPDTKPEVKPEVKKPVVTTPTKKETWPKTPPKNPPATKPTEKTPDDGTVANTENAGENDDSPDYGEEYTGPSYIVDRPASTSEFHLSETAARLATMDVMAFRRIQSDTLGFPWSKGANLRECNYFFMTALVEANVVDEKNIPYFKAALFDTKFFAPKGWQKITVAQMKQWFKEGRVFDVAIQRDPPKGSAHGHIAVPIGLTDQGEVMVAQGNHLKYSNKIVKYSDKALAGFRIFARF